MRKIKRRYKKVIGITGTAVGMFILAVYVSFVSHTKAVETGAVKPTDNYEKYYEKEDTSKQEEKEDSLLTNTKNEKEDEEDFNQELTDKNTDYNSITVLVNKEIGLPKDYIPSDLIVPNVLYNFPAFDEKKQLREEAGKALEELFEEASTQGFTLYAISGYRSYQRQYEIFTHNVKYQGLEHTTKYSAIPGFSEHQTGLSMDVSTKRMRYRLEVSFANTEEGIWLAEEAYKFGFIIRYPKDKSHITGYSYEPWHIRYVGKELALKLFEEDLTLEEYYNFTPSEDYTGSLSYDTLIEEYGIEEEDIKKPTYKPTYKPTPTPSPTPTPDEDKTEDGEETGEFEEELEPTKKPKKSKKPKNTPTPTETPEVTPTPNEDTEETPTEIPVDTPTPEPTSLPTEEPTEEPTEMPTEVPTITPTEAGSIENGF